MLFKEGLIWTIHPRYKQWISFHHLNLVESEFSTPWPAGTHFDLILCRNVMIYFAPEVNRRLIGQFHQSLEDGGWLVVGGAEHNLENYQAFRTVNAAGCEALSKSGCAADAAAGSGAEAASAPQPRRSASREPFAGRGGHQSPADAGRPTPTRRSRRLARRG